MVKAKLRIQRLEKDQVRHGLNIKQARKMHVDLQFTR